MPILKSKMSLHDAGAGDRLGLQCDLTGESVPTAMLPYCGRTLLYGLIRDLQVIVDASSCDKSAFCAFLGTSVLDDGCINGMQAREYLYYKTFGTQETTPVAIMTSAAKGNHQRVLQLLTANNWFGRGRESFRQVHIVP